MPAEPTWYEVLGVDPGASDAAVRQAWRRQVQRWHPDRHANAQKAHLAFLQVQRAYAVLSSPAARAAYDEQLRAARAAPPPSPATPSPLGPKGDDLHLFVSVPLSLIVSGGQARVEGKVGLACPHCQRGCRRCAHVGQILVQRRWTFVVPPGHDPRQWLRLSAAGHTGPFFPVPGDVFIRLMPSPARGWAWNMARARLERTVRAPRQFLDSGGTLELRSPSGQWGRIQVPPGTTRARWLRVSGLAQGAAPAFVRLRVAPWFSWGARRASLA